MGSEEESGELKLRSRLAACRDGLQRLDVLRSRHLRLMEVRRPPHTSQPRLFRRVVLISTVP